MMNTSEMNGAAIVCYEGKSYAVNVRDSSRFKKVFDTCAGKTIKTTLTRLGNGSYKTITTVDWVDDDDNAHGHSVPSMLYVSFKDLKDGKAETRVFNVADGSSTLYEEIGTAKVLSNPLKK